MTGQPEHGENGGVEVSSKLVEKFPEILSKEALEFVARLETKFGGEVEDLLEQRVERQKKINNGELPNFLEETENIRENEWEIAEIPHDLQGRRVEMTGPASSRSMVINALNSGADGFMADFEDSVSPTGDGIMQGQLNLFDAIRQQIDFVNEDRGKKYTLKEDHATLMVRPRGWHMTDKHVLINGKPVSAGLLDFGLYFFHNAQELINQGTGPYFYLAKLQNHKEAALWNKIFVEAQNQLNIEQGTIKATVLIEHVLAAFEMDEILHELKEHSAGLNAGRWDYIFSIIKTFANDPNFLLPDRSEVTMDSPFMSAYAKLLVDTCLNRGAQPIGGMAAQIPIKNNDEANEKAINKVRADKLKEFKLGFEGAWAAHPALVAPIMQEFDEVELNTPIEIDQKNKITQAMLLETPEGEITENGLRINVRVAIEYMYHWLLGNGAVAIDNLMEDAATAEISRSQVWQWLKHGKYLDDGTEITTHLVEEIMSEEMMMLRKKYEKNLNEETLIVAKDLFMNLVINEKITEFLTLKAYEQIN